MHMNNGLRNHPSVIQNTLYVYKGLPTDNEQSTEDQVLCLQFLGNKYNNAYQFDIDFQSSH